MKLKRENIPASQESFFMVSTHNNHNPCQVLWHYHPECELVYVPAGTGRRQVGHHMSQYTNGDLVLIGPQIPHLNFHYQTQGDFEEIIIQFNKKHCYGIAIVCIIVSYSAQSNNYFLFTTSLDNKIMSIGCMIP